MFKTLVAPFGKVIHTEKGKKGGRKMARAEPCTKREKQREREREGIKREREREGIKREREEDYHELIAFSPLGKP